MILPPVRVLALFFLIPSVLILTAASGAQASFPADPVGEIIRMRVEAAVPSARMTVGNEPMLSGKALGDFYRRRLFRPAWSEGGRSLPQAREMVAIIGEVESEGLVPGQYHLQTLLSLLDEIEGRDFGPAPDWQRADLDLVLTDSFLALASHLLNGRINPATVDPDWGLKRHAADPVPVLENALAKGAFRESLRSLLPRQTDYAKLRSSLERYRRIVAQGGWPQVPAGPLLMRDDRERRVVVLRQRLAITGDLPASHALPDELFDAEVDAAVRRFQKRHGLTDDGAVGPETLKALNVSAAERVRQIEINLERWRWFPQDFGDRYILVNIPDYRLQMVEDGEPVLSMRVVVGRPFRPTPVFSDLMRYLVINPTWNVPDLIAVEDILPEVQKDPEYLGRHHLTVIRGWGEREREIDPASVDWDRLSAQGFPFRFRQEPGPLNSLGRIKFMFPNRHNVYLHDTPARELFSRENRSFSSGCIRVEHPLELAERLLQGSAMGSREALSASLAGPPAQILRLSEPVPIHLLYCTAWVDRDGILQLRQDIYGRDLLLEQALFSAPSSEAKKTVFLSPDLWH